MKRNAIIIVGLIVFNLCTPIASAQNVTRPKIACPNDIWVNSYNGVLFYQRTDFSIPGRSMPLEAVFYYNSSSNILNYGYGNGWSLGCEYRYIVDSTGVIIESGDGRQDRYAGAALEAPAGVFNTLSPLPSGGFALRLKDGSVYTFADTVSKRVTSIADRNNNILAFSYNDEGRLASISDASGRTIRLSWTGGMLASVATNLDNRRWEYAYDTAGNLTRVTNPMGYAVYYGYNRDNRINRFTDEAGYSTHITYNSDGMAHRVKTDLTDKSIRYEQASRQTVIVDYLTDGNNQFTTYRWDTLGRVIEKTGNCCGYTSRLEYDEDDNVVRSEDANGNVTTCTYDGNGNMLSLTDPLGYTERYTYTTDGYNNIATYTDKNGHQYTFGYDTHGNLTSINGPLGSQVLMNYDIYGQPISVTDARGNSLTYGYDEYGNRNQITDAAGNSALLTYSPFGMVKTEVSPKGETTHYNYDRLDRQISVVDPLGNTTSFSYDTRGNVVLVTDANNHGTMITYNALCDPLTVVNAEGDSVKYVYNARQKVIKKIVSPTRITHYMYDDRDRVVAEVDPHGDTTRFSYDGLGNIIAMWLPNGREISYSYDAMSRLIESSDQYGVIGKTVYDAYGNVLVSISANGDSTHYAYDALRQLISERNAKGEMQHYSYDVNGNLASHADAMGRMMTYSYNNIDELISETDAMGNTTTFTYDPDGNLSSVTDANGNTTSYRHDANDNLVQITFANGNSHHTKYDGVGNSVEERDENGNTVVSAYDGADRLVRRTYPDGSADVYSYTSTGDMLTAVNTSANIQFAYTADGMLASETLNGMSTSYQYDTRQNTVHITYPGGRSIVEKYDMRNRLVNIVEDGVTIASFSYDGDNYLHTRSYRNGTTATYTFDEAKRLVGLTDAPGVIDYAMTYDADGNMTAKINNRDASRSETYQYDPLHRLVGYKKGAYAASQIPNPTEQIQYALDASGNRTSVSTGAASTSYSHNATNAYTQVSGVAYQYDANGNMTHDGTLSYQYDYRNNIKSVDGGSTATYLYDALNRRIGKRTATDTTWFYYSGYKLLEERDAAGEVKATYIVGRGVDNVVQMRRGGNDYYYHRNHLGSIVAITDSMGAVVERYEYDPYGNTVITSPAGTIRQESAIGNRYMFTGREYDTETGLYYFRARTMVPQLGRFMQADPLLYVDSYNYYTYVDNMPLKYIDADGNRNVVVDFFIGGCLDLIEGWGCSTGAEKGMNAAMCVMDLASFIPGAQGLKGVKVAAKGAKMANKTMKAGKNVKNARGIAKKRDIKQRGGCLGGGLSMNIVFGCSLNGNTGINMEKLGEGSIPNNESISIFLSLGKNNKSYNNGGHPLLDLVYKIIDNPLVQAWAAGFNKNFGRVIKKLEDLLGW